MRLVPTDVGLFAPNLTPSVTNGSGNTAVAGLLLVIKYVVKGHFLGILAGLGCVGDSEDMRGLAAPTAAQTRTMG